MVTPGKEPSPAEPTTSKPLSPRQIAGRQNRMKRNGLTPQGREKLRETALANRPWQFKGPPTAKARAASRANGKVRQIGELSVREVRAAVSEVKALCTHMAELRRVLTKPENSRA
jgi:hypothetical protein